MESEKTIVQKRLNILAQAEESNNVASTCRSHGISRETFYKWKRAYESGGGKALEKRTPGAQQGAHPSRIPNEIGKIILLVRKKHSYGSRKISKHLEQYYGIKISFGGVYQVLKRNGMNQLPSKNK